MKQVAQVATQSSPGSSTVVPGTSVSDSATVTPVVAGQQVASGTVKFFLCQPSEVTAGGCEGQAGTQVGSPAAGETVNGSGVAQSDAAANTSAVGKYCWRAEYSGDGFYGASSHTNSTSECFTTVKQVAQVATQSSPGSSTVVPGTSVSDSATVTPVVAGQQVASGTVKFFLCQPSEVTAGGCEGQAGTQVGSPAAGETVNGSGVAQSDAAANTSAVGKYCWRAEYSGDGFYGASSHTNFDVGVLHDGEAGCAGCDAVVAGLEHGCAGDVGV